MDIYQVWITHNRAWSQREIFCFGIIVVGCCLCFMRLVYQHRMKTQQALAALMLIIYLGIVFGSTVFTRVATTRQYKLVPFWSWKAVLLTHNRTLFHENLLNCILLAPMGALLPIIFGSRIRIRMAFLLGFIVSVVIEFCQLIFMRGLFEWDDMIHNGLGCMLGCLAVNVIIERWRKKRF